MGRIIDVDPAVTAHAMHEAMLDAPYHDVGVDCTLDDLLRREDEEPTSARYVAVHGLVPMARDIGISVEQLDAQLDVWNRTYDEIYRDALRILHAEDRDRHDRDTIVLTPPQRT